MKVPTFFEIDLNKINYLNRCICTQFKRTMKYLMKGFYYNEEKLNSEIKLAKELEPKILNLEKKTCNFCSKPFFFRNTYLK